MSRTTPSSNKSPKTRSARFDGIVVAAVIAIALGVVLANSRSVPPVGTANAEETASFVVASTTETVPATDSAPATITPPAGPSIVAYRGLGSWVDIYDEGVFNNPEIAVRDMYAHGVRTIYVETSNSSRSYAIKRPDRMSRLIHAAHGRKMKVVAWYLPTLRDFHKDAYRCRRAISFRTPKGQKFDSFALDIESSAVKPVSERNSRLMRVSKMLRQYVGPKYPLGAIIPSPWGMKRNGYWSPFPYRSLASVYDVFVPMSYYTYHGDGATAAYDDTIANMTVLRAQSGCATEPVHLIGGIATRSTSAEVRAFVKASKETSAVGASLYAYPETRAGHWTALAALNQ